MSYRRGQQIDCPHCGKGSVVKLQSEMDGWTKVGEYFTCALCGAKLEDEEQTADGDAEPAKAPDRKVKGAAKLSGFLGTTKEEVKEVVIDDGERRFCRDCTHLLKHPFKVHCMLHNKNVNPMDDCPDFATKKDDKKEDKKEEEEA